VGGLKRTVHGSGWRGLRPSDAARNGRTHTVPGPPGVHREPGQTATIRPTSIRALLPYLLYTIEIDPAVTLADLFRLVDRDDVDELELLLDRRISPLLEEARAGSLDSGGAEVLHYLRVSHRHEFGVLRLDLDAPGPRASAGDKGASDSEEERYTVSLEPVGKLLKLPIRYDPELLFRDDAYQVEYRTTMDVSLICFLKAVFDDLTFHGAPAQRDETRQELRELVARIDRGEVEMIPHEEVKQQFQDWIEATGEDDPTP